MLRSRKSLGLEPWQGFQSYWQLNIGFLDKDRFLDPVFQRSVEILR